MRLGYILFSLFCVCTIASADVPKPFEGFEVKPLDLTTNLLTGLYQSEEGLVVCDRGKGALLLLTDQNQSKVLVDGLDTPVDVEKWGDQWLVLQEEAGSLVTVNAKTNTIKEIATGFVHPTAFALSPDNHAYILEFITGSLLKVDLETGAQELLDILFDRPSDIIFTPENNLMVTDQLKLDGSDGAIYWLTPEGEILDIDRTIIDPTGLAIANSGEVYVTSFYIRGQPGGPNNPNNAGGVYRLQSRGQHEVVAEGLFGPTSLLLNSSGNLIVLEEPSDSIYEISLSGVQNPLLEGFGRVQKAVKNKKGAIIAIEKGFVQRLRVANQNASYQTWATVIFGNWEQSALAIDGNDHVYHSEPFLSQVNEYNDSGKVVNQYSNIVPYLLAGIPSGGAYAFTHLGNNSIMTRLGNDNKPSNPGHQGNQGKPDNPGNQEIRFNAKLNACVVRNDGNLLMSFSNGSLKVVSPEGEELTAILDDQTDYLFSSIVPVESQSEDYWLLDDQQQKIIYLDEIQSMTEVAQVPEEGVLLPNQEGVLYLSNSGKQFSIQAVATSINNWAMY